MPSLLVIRLHPVEPISGDDFTGYLNDLTIDAHDASFADPSGDGPVLGSASYIAPNLPPSPGVDPTPDQDPDTRIVQHFSLTPVALPNFSRDFAAVATAVIVIPDPPAGGEFRTADVRLVIRRGANETLHKQIYYNVPVAPAPIPADPNAFAGMEPVGLHLALTSPSQQLGAGALLPEAGTAPNFAALRAAV